MQALAFSIGLTSHVTHKAEERAQASVRRAVERAEWRLNKVLIGISRLSMPSFSVCSDFDADELRRVVANITAIKELAILGPDGHPRCQHFGLGGNAQLLSRDMPLFEDPNVSLAVVRPTDREPALRVRWERPSEPLSLAGIIPADLMGGRQESGVRLHLADGTLVVATNDNSEIALADRAYARGSSGRYPFEVTASVSYAEVWADIQPLVIASVMTSSLIAILLVGFASWGSPNNPVAAIRRGIRSGEFIPYVQPIVDLTTGRVVGGEVLARWQQPDGSILTPQSFIALVETSGLTLELTDTLMHTVRKQLGATLGRHPNVHIGFNLDSMHLVDQRIVNDIQHIFGGSPIRFEQIVLEITERQPLRSLASAREVIGALQKLGCRVAIDDVGAGHSGLSYILKLGVDTIKIDRIFIDAIDEDRHSAAIIETLVRLASKLRLRLIAEGVETVEQAKILREIGVTLAQGYVFAPPLPARSFATLVDAAHSSRAREPARDAA